VAELSWAETRRQVYARAEGCCEYCRTCEHNTGQSLHVEHIIPDANNSLDNLCLACASCNLSKARATSAIDPDTQQTVALFNPRTQIWTDHFEWIDGGVRIGGTTPTGRATVLRLKVNQDRLVRARRNWIRSGNHPPL